VGSNQSGLGARYRESPVFEFECFAILGREIGEDDARRLLADFTGEARRRIDDMRSSLVTRDKRALGQAARALNTVSAMLGMAPLAAISRELERVSAGEDRDGIETLIQAAGAAFHDANPFIEEALAAA